jgi:hypothetical protein
MTNKYETKTKFSKTTVPTVLQQCEAWVRPNKNVSEIQAMEIYILRIIKRCTELDKITIEDIQEELYLLLASCQILAWIILQP